MTAIMRVGVLGAGRARSRQGTARLAHGGAPVVGVRAEHDGGVGQRRDDGHAGSVQCGGSRTGDRAARSGLVEAVLDELGELLAVVERQERGRGGVELERLEVVEVVAERVAEQRELARERRAAHQAVVGVDRDPEAELVEQVERVVDELVAPRRDRAGLQVRRGAQSRARSRGRAPTGRSGRATRRCSRRPAARS